MGKDGGGCFGGDEDYKSDYHHEESKRRELEKLNKTLRTGIGIAISILKDGRDPLKHLTQLLKYNPNKN